MNYYKRKLAEMPCNVGVAQSDGSRSSDGAEGYISYGPYLPLEGGKYFAGFHVRKLASGGKSAALTIDAACRSGAEALGLRTVPAYEILTEIPGLLGLEFDLAEPCADFELRLHVAPGVKVNVTDIVLFRL